MSKKLFYVLILMLMFLPIFSSYANENEAIEPTEATVEATKSPTITKSPERTNKEKNERLLREKERVKDKMEAERERVKNNMEKEREIMKNKQEEARERLMMNKEEFQASKSASREEFKKKMADFRDEKKKEVVEKLDQRINTINTTRTASLVEKLDKLTQILDKIESRVKEIESTDTAAVTASILAARDAISKARVEVEAQAAKNYVLQISSESAVKTDVSSTIQSMKSDIQIVIESVRSAKKAVQAAHEELRQLRGNVTPPSVSITP